LLQVIKAIINQSPVNPYFISRHGLEVKPLGAYPLGPRSSSCGPTKGTHHPETLYVPTEVNTLHLHVSAHMPDFFFKCLPPHS